MIIVQGVVDGVGAMGGRPKGAVVREKHVAWRVDLSLAVDFQHVPAAGREGERLSGPAHPVVGLVQYRGSKENYYVNPLMGTRNDRVDCIIRDESDPDPARRYKTAVPNVFRQGGGLAQGWGVMAEVAVRPQFSHHVDSSVGLL